MSYIEKTLYSIVCDCCQKDFLEGTDFTAITPKEEVLHDDHEWAVINNERHYCPDCYEAHWSPDKPVSYRKIFVAGVFVGETD